MIDTNTAAGWCSHTHTHTHLSHLLRCSCICMSIVIYASWRGCEPIWEQGQHTGQLICKSVAYLWMCTCECLCVCISVAVCVYKSVRMSVSVEVSVGNRLIITWAPSFIIFIEFFPASALGVCKSHKFYAIGCRLFSVCVCLCVFQVMSTECWLLLPIGALTPLFAAGSRPTFWPLLLFPGKAGVTPFEERFPSEWLSVNGVPMVSSVLCTGLWVKKIRLDLHTKRCWGLNICQFVA